MSDNDGLVLAILIGIPLVLAFYGLPAIVAFRRRHPNRWLILAVTVMLGSTGFGWAFALVWAFNAAHRSERHDGAHGGESGLNLFVNDVTPVRLVGPLAASPTIADAVAEIERLGALRAAGHLSEAEFADLKSAVLRRMR